MPANPDDFDIDTLIHDITAGYPDPSPTPAEPTRLMHRPPPPRHAHRVIGFAIGTAVWLFVLIEARVLWALLHLHG